MVSLRYIVRPGIVTIKGGLGSGHRGHAGRPGSVGGSLPGSPAARWRPARGVTTTWHPGTDEALSAHNLTKDVVENLFTLSGLELELEVGPSDRPNGILITGSWYTPLPDGEHIGDITREFYTDSGKSVAQNTGIVLTRTFQDRGLAKSLYDRQIDQLRKVGFDRIELEADVTIGRYAWAKKGFDYKNETRLAFTNKRFAHWANSEGIQKPAAGWPEFKSAHDVATFKIPGISMLGKTLNNKDVPNTMKLSVGKAFMLDKRLGGHGEWDAVLHLQK